MPKDIPVKMKDPAQEQLLAALAVVTPKDGIVEDDEAQMKWFRPFLLPTLLVPPGPPGGIEGHWSDEEKQRGWPNRPQAVRMTGNSSSLLSLADIYHEGYKTAIFSIASGAAPKAAFMALGFPPQWVYRWMDVGSLDIRNSEDTYFSRTAFDIVKALGIATREAQIKLWEKRPDMYLSRGPGQAAGSEYADAQTIPSVITTQVGNIALPSNEPRAASDEDKQRTAIETQRKWFSDLERRGLSVSGIVQAYEDQHG